MAVGVQDAPGRLVLEDSVVHGTLPDAFTGDYGFGIGADLGGQIEGRRIAVSDNHVAGLFAENQATLLLEDATFSGTTLGAVRLVTRQGDAAVDGARYTDLADGVLVVGSVSVTVARASARGCARAGFLFEGSAGEIRDVVANANRFGLVVQGSRAPQVDETTCSFVANSESNVIAEGALAVPDAPLAAFPVASPP